MSAQPFSPAALIPTPLEAGEGLQLADTPTTRHSLHETWRVILGRMRAAGLPQGTALQTMATIAAEEFATLLRGNVLTVPA